MNRKRPIGSSGALAALLIGGRDFAYTICRPCDRKLFYTYVGEPCPFCEAVVTEYVEGKMPDAILADSMGREVLQARAG